MSESVDDWERVDRESNGRIKDQVVGIGPSGAFHIYKTTRNALFGEDALDGVDVEIRQRPDGDAFAVLFDGDDPNYRMSGKHTPSTSIRGVLQGMDIEPPEEVAHLDFEWDEEQQIMVVDTSDLR